jgi:hypothetical protein
MSITIFPAIRSVIIICKEGLLIRIERWPYGSTSEWNSWSMQIYPSISLWSFKSLLWGICIRQSAYSILTSKNPVIRFFNTQSKKWTDSLNMPFESSLFKIWDNRIKAFHSNRFVSSFATHLLYQHERISFSFVPPASSSYHLDRSQNQCLDIPSRPLNLVACRIPVEERHKSC